ncbi:hypothetical protein [Methylocucumis oryzae]|uniref:hypothetical protein n=1 Tax=Methylocucumis oryzae TaxID=1632867 RepID=UPI000695BC6C|nr:hypothetical protein [Methylocucumis oryzae]
MTPVIKVLDEMLVHHAKQTIESVNGKNKVTLTEGKQTVSIYGLPDDAMVSRPMRLNRLMTF